MEVINAVGVSEAFFHGIQLLNDSGIVKESRAGKVIEYPEPVCTVYQDPQERVLFYEERNANPFFHFFEAFWMLAGRRDVAYVTEFNKRMQEFSDDLITFNGAYGYRWRHYYGYDQLDRIVRRLGQIGGDRRAVLTMWDAHVDLKEPELNHCKDLPCNTHIYFKIRPCDPEKYSNKDFRKSGQLDMTVCCRSNDIIWGKYGTNIVHFSMLQEYMAARLNVEIGIYRHMSDSFHAYLDVFEKVRNIQPDYKPYDEWDYEIKPLVDYPPTFKAELLQFLENPQNSAIAAKNSIFRSVAYPMYEAWRLYKDLGDISTAVKCSSNIEAKDWQKACVEWLERRKK